MFNIMLALNATSQTMKTSQSTLIHRPDALFVNAD